jgi:hypothetical protein
MVCLCQVEEVSEFSERSNSDALFRWYSVPFGVADGQDSTQLVRGVEIWPSATANGTE